MSVLTILIVIVVGAIGGAIAGRFAIAVTPPPRRVDTEVRMRWDGSTWTPIKGWEYLLPITPPFDPDEALALGDVRKFPL